MPTGWRPDDVAEKYPWSYWKNAYEQVKYDSKPSQTLFAWSWFQLVVNFAMVFHVLVAFVNFQYLEVMLYAIFMMVSIFAYTSLMDKAKVALPAEVIRFVMGIGLIYWNGGWFGLQEFIPGANVLVGIYLASSLVMVFLILSKEAKAKLDVKPAELVSSN